MKFNSIGHKIVVSFEALEQVLGSCNIFDFLKECVANESSKVLWLFLFLAEYCNMDSNVIRYMKDTMSWVCS